MRHRNSRYLREESEDSSPEYHQSGHHREQEDGGRHCHKYRHRRNSREQHASVTDLRGHHHDKRHQKHHNHKTQSEDKYTLDQHRRSNYWNKLDSIIDDFKTYTRSPHDQRHHQKKFGELGDSYFTEKSYRNNNDLDNSYLQRTRSYSKHCYFDEEKDHLRDQSVNELIAEESLNKVIDKLKSDFFITPKRDSDSILEKALTKDGKGIYVYVPLPEDKDPKKVAKHLDSIYKNIFNSEDKLAEKDRRKKEIRRIVEKYSYPERNPSSRLTTSQTELKILCDTFFKKCDQERVQPRTTFDFHGNQIKPQGSLTDIIEDISRLSPRETNSEFLAKFENKLRRAIRNKEENCTCPSSSQWPQRQSEHRLDSYVNNLVGVLQGR